VSKEVFSMVLGILKEDTIKNEIGKMFLMTQLQKGRTSVVTDNSQLK